VARETGWTFEVIDALTLWDLGDLHDSFERFPPLYVLQAALAGWEAPDPKPATPAAVKTFAAAMSSLNRK
jgi:hypothetical protein